MSIRRAGSISRLVDEQGDGDPALMLRRITIGERSPVPPHRAMTSTGLLEGSSLFERRFSTARSRRRACRA